MNVQKIKSYFPPNSLKVQLLSRSLLVLAILLVFIGLFQYIFMRDVIYRNKAESLRSQIASIPRNVWQLPDTDLDNDNILHPPRFFIPGTSLAFIDANGNYSELANEHNKISPPVLDTKDYLEAFRNKSKVNYKIINDAAGKQQLVVLQQIGHPGEVQGIIQISTPTNPLKELLFRQLLTFLLLAFIALIIGLLALLPVLKKTLVPLSNMVDTAEQIDAGNLDRRFPVQQGQIEVDRLAESFNGMLKRLEASFKAERETKEQMRRFIADASHELRTPLTSIHGFLEVLLRGAANQPDQLDKALTSMYGESKRLNKLVQGLLLLAKLDRTPHLELKEGLLDTVIRDMEPQLRILAGSRDLSLLLEPNMKCNFDVDSMKQVVLNLFHNAVQQTDPEKGHIQIALAEKDNGVQLSIQDNGPGIKAVHIPHIFDRFYRSDSSRTRRYGGAGLGLSITKSIVEAHGGIISAASQEGEGCTFKVWLPK